MGFAKLARLGGNKLQRPLGVPVAIDFGSAALKVLQITSDNPPALVAAGSVPTPDNLLDDVKKRLEFQVDSLGRLVHSLPFKGRRAVCAIPAALTFCKHAQFSRQESLPVDVLADTMLTEQLGRDASTLVRRLIEIESAERAGAKQEYICLATGREIVEHLMKALRSAKLEPVGMHSEYEAVVQAFRYVNRRADDQHRATLYLDIGCRQTRVIIAHGTSLVFARNVDIGGNTLDECLSKELSCTLAEARAKRLAMSELVHPARAVAHAHAPGGAAGGVAVAEDRRTGEPAAGLIDDVDESPPAPIGPGASLREPLEVLTDEVAMCIRYHDSMHRATKVSRIVFVGGESRHRGLCQHVARALKLPAQVADPLARIARAGAEGVVGLELDSPQPGWAVAVGLCESPTDL